MLVICRYAFNLFTIYSIPEQAVGCYCCLLEQERSPEQPDADGNGHVICFLGGSEKGLNLYPLSLLSFTINIIYVSHCSDVIFPLVKPCTHTCSELYSLTKTHLD